MPVFASAVCDAHRARGPVTADALDGGLYGQFWLVAALDRTRFERFFAIAVLLVPSEQKNALAGRSGGCKRHAEHQNLVRQRQWLWLKSSSVQHSKTHALVTWWLLPAAKTLLASPISQWHPYVL